MEGNPKGSCSSADRKQRCTLGLAPPARWDHRDSQGSCDPWLLSSLHSKYEARPNVRNQSLEPHCPALPFTGPASCQGAHPVLSEGLQV